MAIVLGRKGGGAAGGGAPSGPAGGSLGGTYPNPSIAAGAVDTAELANDAVDATKIATNAVGSSELADNAVDTAAIVNNAVTAAKVAADVATQAELDAAVAALESAWTAYTPAWTASGTQPAIGDGTRLGAFKLIGKTLHLRIAIVMGGTTTFGTGTYNFGLPAGMAGIAGVRQTAAALGFDAGTAWREGAMILESGSGSVSIASNGSATQWGQTVPHTWANGDAIYIQATVELA